MGFELPSLGEISICVVYMCVNMCTQIHTSQQYCVWELSMGVLIALALCCLSIVIWLRDAMVKIKGPLSSIKKAYGMLPVMQKRIVIGLKDRCE